MKATPRYAMLVNTDGNAASPLEPKGRMLHAVENALCEDGQRRVAVVTSHGERRGDPVPSRPAVVKMASGGTQFTITGYLQRGEDGDWTFTASRDGKNAWVLTTG